jgi:tetratricopeptide (TPR) repeat protein
MAFTTAISPMTALETHGTLVRELAGLADELADPDLRFRAANARFIHAMHGGDREGLDAGLAVMRELADAIGQPIHRWTALWTHSARRSVAGDLVEAEALTMQAAAVAHEQHVPDGLLITFGQLLSIRTEQDRLEELVDALERQAAHNPGLRLLQVTRGFIAAETGRRELAASILEATAADGYAFAFDRTRPFNLARCADIALRVGAAGTAADLYERLLPHREQFATPAGISSRGSIELSLGRLASALRRFERADEHLAAAERAHAALGAPLLQARTQLALGESLLRRGRAGEATQPLLRAVSLARRHGSAAVERESAALLARAGTTSAV